MPPSASPEVPMFIDTSEFASASRAVDVTFARPPMEGTVGSGESVHLAGTVRRTRDGVRFTGHLETQVSLECARCGESYPAAVATDFALIYRGGDRPAPDALDGAGAEVMLSEQDCLEAELDENGRIDLLQLVREQVYLDLPLKPICRESCRGLCTECGVNLNTNACGCAPPTGDPRWAALAGLKDRFSSKN